MKLKVATYNIHAGRTSEDVERRSFDFAAELINEIGPDIIGLNEVGRHATAGLPVLEMECEPMEHLGKKTGMHYYFAEAIKFGGHGYGNGLLSKYPIKNARTVIIPDVERNSEEYAQYYETRCILAAEVDVCGGILVLVSHFGLMVEEKKNAVATALTLIKESEKPVLLMGDLNMMADDSVLSPIFDVLNDTACGNKEPYTWPSNMEQYVGDYEAKIKNIKGKDSGRKIDYIFCSDHFKTEKIEVIQSLVSDHMPYVAEVEIEEGSM